MSRMAVWHCPILVVFGLIAVFAWSQPCAVAADAGKPNIIFIMADDLGYGDLGCYGQKEVRTPNIDRLAAEGMRFTSWYAGSTVCAPSRSCLMTGQHTGHTRVRGNGPRIPLEAGDLTLAKILKPAGYATGMFGKWGLGDAGTTGAPTRQGFDEWFGFLDQALAHNYYPEHLWRGEEEITLKGNLGGKKGEYVHDLFTREALSFIERHRGSPFFLYLPYTIPHANNEAGKEGMQVPDDAPYSSKPWPQQEKNFATMVTRLDRDVGSIMSRLKEYRIDDKTIVFFTSDNGPHREGGNDPNYFHSSGPLRGIKRDLYEGGIRVPMIIRWPGRIKAGSVYDRPAAHWDILPTLAEIAGTKVPEGIDGISVLSALMGEPQREHEYFYWEFHEKPAAQAVRMGDWKYVRHAPAWRGELYDLARDIGERKDVSREHPDVMEKMESILRTARSESQFWPAPMESAKPQEKK